MSAAGQAEFTATVAEALGLLHEGCEVFEVRIPSAGRAGTVSGYFDDPEAAARALARYDGKAPGIYVTLNPVDPALLARASNRLRERARETTSDDNVVARRWFGIDVDFKRPSGISATAEEVRAAGAAAKEIAAFLTEVGWPEPVLVNSGNGAWLLYRLELANDAAARDLLQRCLKALALIFNTPEGVDVDQTVFNAARIAKVPGTLACKGDSTSERPHRRSRIVTRPEALVPVAQELLQALADRAPAETPRRAASGGNGHAAFDLDGFVCANHLELRRHKSEGGADTWELAECPFNADHSRGEAWIRREASGALSAGCQHASCAWTWADLRELFEPGHRERAERARHKQAQAPRPAQRRGATTTAEAASQASAPAAFNLTDTGNAARFLDLYADVVRYCATWRGWVVYDGKRWRRDDDLAAEHLAAEAHRTIYAEAEAADDPKRRAELGKWALVSESAQHRRATLECARSDRRIAARPADFDPDPWRLNCENGTLDLRTGSLRPHEPADMITKLVPVAYDPAARSELWERVLGEATGGDVELQAFLQRAFGYSMTGSTAEEAFFVLVGDTETGKSTISNAVRATLGDYADDIKVDSFLRQRNVGGTRGDLLKLEGVRLGIIAEAVRGTYMDEGLLKTFVSGEPLTVAKKYQNEQTMTPVTKLWMHTNFVPRMSEDDDAVWRRARIVSFCHHPERVDATIKPKLCDPATSGTAILAWLVRGCQEWQRLGLGSCTAVTRATCDLRAEMDELADFWQAYCVFAPDAWVEAKALLEARRRWAEEVGIDERRLPTGRLWGEHLKRRGCSRDRRWDGRHRVRVWNGVRLADAPSEQTFGEYEEQT
jgi:putative DNA primase/helicase